MLKQVSIKKKYLHTCMKENIRLTNPRKLYENLR